VPNSSTICVDANVAVITATAPSRSTDLWDGWRQRQDQLVAPRLIRYELVNVIVKSRRAGAISDSTATDLMTAMLELPITLLDSDSMHIRALALALRFDLPATYDARYLALAAEMVGEFWTADRRLARAVQAELDWVHLVE
jgi:predicted nucleic acid-binding protein